TTGTSRSPSTIRPRGGLHQAPATSPRPTTVRQSASTLWTLTSTAPVSPRMPAPAATRSATARVKRVTGERRRRPRGGTAPHPGSEPGEVQPGGGGGGDAVAAAPQVVVAAAPPPAAVGGPEAGAGRGTWSPTSSATPRPRSTSPQTRPGWPGLKSPATAAMAMAPSTTAV